MAWTRKAGDSALAHYNKHHVTKKQWDERAKQELEGEVHPCTSWDALECDCAGACSCHWKDNLPRS